MDFGNFGKAVARAARAAEEVAERATPAAERAAPAFKAGTLIVLPFVTLGTAAPFVPFLAAVPAQAFLPIQIAAPLFLFSRPFREGVGESVERDSAPAAVHAGFTYFLATPPR